ncbi:MAG TPA: UvrD-helicase domain-containing protein [Desulfomonilaceae bacterium]|nr:UvrD-helicase domain-containing protein [Desulfomonilaceae bacterium]
MIYFADLHVHSKYSRATSRDCNLIELARWAALKGIRVLATGDFTHPAWRGELKEMLVEAEAGLFRLAEQYTPESIRLEGGFGPGDVRFILNVEISSIYKKKGATRKVHNLVFMPDFESIERFSARLDRIGNINSDGRPILGLDSRDLLEIAIETNADSFLVPAHIWTPWFSILGSRSGFDSVEECFDDLTPHIFALETGLSSDPEMNHRLSALDRYTLISNSDTHSPQKLGREANIFQGEPGYLAIRDSLRAGGGEIINPAQARITSEPEEVGPGSDSGTRLHSTTTNDPAFLGTIEFFPEEGKYHLDGHRKCGARLDPAETQRLGGRCPICGHPVTVGVMNRVMELADRQHASTPERGAPYWRLLTLLEVIAQSLDVGPQSKKVDSVYRDLLKKLGPELMILWALPLDRISQHASEIVSEAIRRVRAGEVSIAAGFDGEYGTVKLFGAGERDHFAGQSTFIPAQSPGPRRGRQNSANRTSKKNDKKSLEDIDVEIDGGLNKEQQASLEVVDRPVLVQAGPGTGKTRTLTHRIADLIENHLVDPGTITAVTFTRKASSEMRERLERIIGKEQAGRCWLGTFHQLGGRVLDMFAGHREVEAKEKVLTDDEALKAFRHAVSEAGLGVPPASVTTLRKQVSLLKQNLYDPNDPTPDPILARAYNVYEESLRASGALDLDDLLLHPVRLLKDRPAEARQIGRTVAAHLLVDEFQDVNRAQYEMVRLLADPSGEGLFVIGDPDQAIYGFRGADRRFFLRFCSDYPQTVRVNLVQNYRSQANILEAAQHALHPDGSGVVLAGLRPAKARVRAARLPNAATEAEFIIRTIDACLGGSSFFSLDSRDLPIHGSRQLGFGDFAVLFRLNAVGDSLEEAFQSSGIPFQRARKSAPEEEAEALDPRAEAVTLMTIHASKGLEFPVVFIAGCEDGIIPYISQNETELSADDLDEERRLLYVAMTRAQDEVFLTRADSRTLHGRSRHNPPCRFLERINPEVWEFLAPLNEKPSTWRKRPQQYDLFS